VTNAYVNWTRRDWSIREPMNRTSASVPPSKSSRNRRASKATTRPFLLCEETALTRRVIVREREKIIELGTMDFLKLLEAEQRIQSAEAVFERALAAGRSPSQTEKFGEHEPAMREAVRDTLRAVQRDRSPKR